MKIKDSVALVTGANRGLGFALVRALRDAGARKVYAAARSPSLNATDDGVEPVLLDVTDHQQIRAAAARCKDVTLLVNNAGVAFGTSFLADDPLHAARAEMETNYFGPLEVSRSFAPVLGSNGGGAIVNVLSVLSWLNVPQFATYSASKAAAWSLTNGLRGELLAQGTHVMAVHVGYMDTDMVRHVDAPKAQPSDVAQLMIMALEAGHEELLVDEFSKEVKRSLSGEPVAAVAATSGR
jgi:NAD(P)-dependent dehydrogenase (short-subunit alcohol dehydrogenase family)